MIIAWDTETDLIAPGLLAPPLACISWAKPNGHAGLVHYKKPQPVLDEILDGRSVGHNVPYDLAVLCAEWPHLTPRIFQMLVDKRVHDTMTREKLIDIALGRYRVRTKTYSLADLTKIHFNEVLDKDEWRLKYGTLRKVELVLWPEGAKRYPVLDAKSTLQLYQEQEKHSHLLLNEADQVRAHWALHLAACWGIRVDQKRVSEIEKILVEEIAVEREKLIEYGLIKPNGVRDTKKIKALVQKSIPSEKLKLTPKGNEDFLSGESWASVVEAGKFSTDAQTLKDTEHPMLLSMASFGEKQKQLTTYVAALKRAGTAPIQTRWESLLATGRTSSSNPNIQNMPAKEPASRLRECFVPTPGQCFVVADYDKAELVSLAQICLSKVGYSRLAEALNAGFDPHTAMSATLLKCKYHEVDPWDIQIRKLAKAANFGFPGGMGPDKFCIYAKGMFGLALLVEEARGIRDAYFETWPEIKEYLTDFIGRSIDPNTNTCDVKQLVSNRFRGDCFFTEAANSYFQGLTADAVKAALFEITRRQYCEKKSALYGTHIVNFVHDEIILETPINRCHEAGHEMVDVMISEYRKYTPDVTISSKPIAMMYWSKDFQAPKIENNRLVPWGL